MSAGLVIGNEQRRPAAAIEVAGVDAHARNFAAGHVQPAAAGHGLFHELAAALIVKQIGWLHVVGDVNVQPAIAVQVGHQHGQPGAGARRRCPDATPISVNVPLPLLR